LAPEELAVCYPALSRRRLLRLALAVSLAPMVPGSGRSAFAADAPLLAVTAPEAQAQGPCQLFPGKQVKAAGWCTGWAPQM
jgi:hypothetical protein